MVITVKNTHTAFDLLSQRALASWKMRTNLQWLSKTEKQQVLPFKPLTLAVSDTTNYSFFLLIFLLFFFPPSVLFSFCPLKIQS